MGKREDVLAGFGLPKREEAAGAEGMVEEPNKEPALVAGAAEPNRDGLGGSAGFELLR